MHPVEKFQQELAAKYSYKPLPADESRICRELFRRTIPDFLKVNGDTVELYNFSGTLITKGYTRIVIGDYGAFVEFVPMQAAFSNFIIKPGEEYRLSERYGPTVKYNWLTTKDHSDIKIYQQKRTVAYADYQPDCFYVSVFDVKKWA